MPAPSATADINMMLTTNSETDVYYINQQQQQQTMAEEIGAAVSQPAVSTVHPTQRGVVTAQVYQQQGAFFLFLLFSAIIHSRFSCRVPDNTTTCGPILRVVGDERVRLANRDP